jgi:hypothetical protein
MNVEIIEYENNVRKFVLKNIITSSTKTDKAIEDVTRQLTFLFIKHQIDFNNFIDDYKNDRIINAGFLNEPGIHNVLDHVSDTYKMFASELFSLRPTGLGTPNSAVGEGELMLFVLSLSCRKPSKGDVSYNGSIKEFKSESPRVYGRAKGDDFRKDTVKLANNFGLEVPVNSRTNKETVELTEGGDKNRYWNAELSKLSIEDRISFVSKYLQCTKSFTEEEALSAATVSIGQGDLCNKLLVKEICKYFFKDQLNFTIGDNIIMFKNMMAINIDYNFESFCLLLDSGVIVPSDNFFRLSQQHPLGWYIKSSLFD